MGKRKRKRGEVYVGGGEKSKGKKKEEERGISYGCIEGGKRKMRKDGILGVVKKKKKE